MSKFVPWFVAVGLVFTAAVASVGLIVSHDHKSSCYYERINQTYISGDNYDNLTYEKHCAIDRFTYDAAVGQ